jgi:diguanylate cyclase (GGDEF)-like protein
MKWLLITLAIIFLFNTPLHFIKKEIETEVIHDLALISNAISQRNHIVQSYLNLSETDVAKQYISHPQLFSDWAAHLIKSQSVIKSIQILDNNISTPCHEKAPVGLQKSAYTPNEHSLIILKEICNKQQLIGHLSIDVDIKQLIGSNSNNLIMVDQSGLIYDSSVSGTSPASNFNELYPEAWKELERARRNNGMIELHDFTMVYRKIVILDNKTVWLVKKIALDELIPPYIYLIVTLVGAMLGISFYVIRIRRQKNQLTEISYTDQLSGLYNRHYLQKMTSEIENDGHYHICLIDIDRFKRVNDKFGHDVGDQVIKRVAAVIKTRTRFTDYVFRFGGEEFLLLIKTHSRESAKEIAERIRHDIEHIAQAPMVTISAGLAPINGDLNQAIKTADTQLYKAKHNGRNNIC